MDNFEVLTTERLRTLISDTEETLANLKEELERREQLKQEHEVANLENHMQSAELSLKTIREFIDFLVRDLRSKHD
mgnify:CR=1 FL=1